MDARHPIFLATELCRKGQEIGALRRDWKRALVEVQKASDKYPDVSDYLISSLYSDFALAYRRSSVSNFAVQFS